MSKHDNTVDVCAPFFGGGCFFFFFFSGGELQIKFTLPTVSLLLVEAEDVHASKVDKNTGLLMELRGMALELRTRPVDMSMMVHLESLTLEDRARPDDSPFR